MMEYEDKHISADVRVIPWTIETYRIRILSWNIEGLDLEALRNRTIAVCDRIIREDPHVVFLQEVIPETEEILAELCPMYKLITVDDDNEDDDDDDDNDGEDDQDEDDDDDDDEYGPAYYVAMLLKKDVVQIKEEQIIPYPNSTQSRYLLRVMCTIKGEQFVLMTTHLESCRASSVKRMEQLQLCFSQCLKEDNDKTVIFGGDLNLREYEAKNVGTPEGIFDLWELNGEDPKTKYTWDMLYNDNLKFDSKPRCRFDRIYMRHSNPMMTKLEHFELAGFGRLKDCQMFCSDHWALLAHFNIISRVPYYAENKTKS